MPNLPPEFWNLAPATSLAVLMVTAWLTHSRKNRSYVHLWVLAFALLAGAWVVHAYLAWPVTTGALIIWAVLLAWLNVINQTADRRVRKHGLLR